MGTDFVVCTLAYVIVCSLMIINPPNGRGIGISIDAVGSILGIFHVPEIE